MDLQQCLSLAIVGLTAALMTRSWLRKRRTPTGECGECGNCTSPQKTIRYRPTGRPIA